MDVRSWLHSLDLERYADAFEDNELEWGDLPDLTSDDLKEELGVKRLPDRKKLLKAIADLGGEAPGGDVTETSAAPAPPEDTAPEAAPEPPPKSKSKPARTLTGRNKAVVPSDPYVNKTLADRFRVDAPLGAAGASGQVYRATQTSSGTAVAVKVIPADIAQDEAALDAFRDVAQRAGQLGAPPFIEVHEFGDAGGGAMYLVTDYVGGTSLGGALEASGPMDPPMALDIAAKVASAMETAHDAGLFHGDLKPSNVLLGDAEGDVRISDFGVVRLMPGGAMTSLNESDRWLTGAEYLAPEQALGEGADERTDVYAVGVLLYEMLTGRPPFVSGSGPATLKRVIYEKPLPLHLHKTVPGLSNDLEAVVMRALSKSPTGRFSSMSDFRQAIEHLTRKAAGESAEAEAAPAAPGREHARTTVMEALPAGVVEAAKAEAEAEAKAKAEADAQAAAEAEAKAEAEAEAEAKAKAKEEEEARSESAKTTMVLTAAPTATAKADDAPATKGRKKRKKKAEAQPETEADMPKARRKRKKRTKKGPASTVQAVGGAAAAIGASEVGDSEDEAVLTNRPDGEGGYAWEVPAVDSQSDIETGPHEAAEPDGEADAAAEAAKDDEAKTDEAAKAAPAEEAEAKPEAEAEEAPPERETKESRSKERRAKARRKKKRSMTGDEPQASERRTRKERRRTRTGESRARTPNERVYTGEFEHVHPEHTGGGKGDDWFVSSAAEMAQADLERHYMEDEGKIFGLSGSTFITLAVVGVLAVAFILMLASADDKAAPDLRPSAQAEAMAQSDEPAPAAPADLNEADANDGGDVLTGSGGSQLGFIMGKAEQAYSQGRFLPPAAANVREYIDEIRGIDPDNSFAKELEQRTTDKLSADARAAYKKRKWQQAHDHYERLTRFAPWDEPAKKRLAELREKLGLPALAGDGGAAAPTDAAAADAAGAAGDAAGAAGDAAPAADGGSAFAVAAATPEDGGAAPAVAALGGTPEPTPTPTPTPAVEPPAKEEPKAKKKARDEPKPKRKAARERPAKKASKKSKKAAPAKVAKASPVNAQDARRLVNEGRRMLRNAKYPDARKAFTDAIKANSRSAAAHAGLGEVSFQMGRFADAVRYHRKAISLDRNNGKYHTSLANAYYKLREYARAIAHWKRALELDPSNSLARSYIRIAQQKLNSER